ncbi:RES domain-containing protein [Pedobacter sp. HMWF019]|uniref:RES family NAD+ phosphorylase n=1 Tax=Pedobacter sp. HMWF019 TaxID=2056856 RepID=UPI000D3A21B7|nr:RES family NAD+ phosphorylase [Pedobacter sp. HMWF019]PTT00259.1 RES domain-containing protein [Pedobacter sp. HMWF019]
MLVYRITLAKYATALMASGRAARWNPNEIDMIYTSGSISLACLENVVHRNQLGLNSNFRVMTIEIPDDLLILDVKYSNLPSNWTDFEHMPITQTMGEDWIKQGRSPVLKVCSSIIDGEYNYLLNPMHTDFKLIKLLDSKSFVFDKRIKGL